MTVPRGLCCLWNCYPQQSLPSCPKGNPALKWSQVYPKYPYHRCNGGLSRKRMEDLFWQAKYHVAPLKNGMELVRTTSKHVSSNAFLKTPELTRLWKCAGALYIGASGMQLNHSTSAVNNHRCRWLLFAGQSLNTSVFPRPVILHNPASLQRMSGHPTTKNPISKKDSTAANCV